MSYAVILSKPQDVLVKELFNYFNAESYDISHLSLVDAPVAQEGPYNTYQRIAITPHPEGVDVGTAIIHFNRIDLSTLFSVVEVKLREVDIKADGTFDPELILAEVQRKYGINTASGQFGITTVEGQDYFYAKNSNSAFIGSVPVIVEWSLETRVDNALLNGFSLYTEVVFDDVWITVESAVPNALKGVGSSAVTIGDYVYMQLGYSAWKMSLVDYTWTALPNCPLNLEYATSVEYKGNWYLCHGRRTSSNARHTNLYKFDTITNTWTTVSSDMRGTLDLAATVVGDTLYTHGGWPNGRTNELWSYNFVTGESRSIGYYGAPAQSGTMVHIDGLLYIYGGTTGGAGHGSFVIYDIVNDVPVSVGVGPHVIFSHSAVAVDSKMYIFGGNGNEGEVNIYDTVSKLWSTGKSMPVATHYSPAVFDRNRNCILLISGHNNPHVLKYS